MLRLMEPNTVFAVGVLLDNKDGLFMTGSGRELTWVAVRGGIDDWAIYCHFSDKSIEYIKNYGDKVYGYENIRRCVICDEEALNCYRY